jgi:class 3 adenylate cyclase
MNTETSAGHAVHMMDGQLHPELAHWAELIERLRWAGFLLDRDFRLVWASPDLKRFLDSPEDDELGYGLHVFEAFNRDAWRRIASSESRARLTKDLAPVVMHDRGGKRLELESVSDRVSALLHESDPRPFTRAIATSFDYVEPGGDSALPVMRVNMLLTPLRDETGASVGALGLGYMSVRPGLVSLLARGDEAMYERMAKLVEPQSQKGAILFCDLVGSTDLARMLPTAEYFRLIRSLWTEIDALVAHNQGIVGKHAGDGASAFFLVDDLGSPSQAASAAIRTARAIHDRSEDIFGTALDSSCLMRVGIHWGSSLYIGQLVPGGRLDIAALGDTVNECARIQDCADPRQTLASKQLIEQLSPDDGATLRIDAEEIRYRPLAEIAEASEKAIAVAGAIPVAVV